MLRHRIALSLFSAVLFLAPPIHAQAAKKAAGPDSTTTAGCLKLLQAKISTMRKEYEAAGRKLGDDSTSAQFQREISAYVDKLVARFDIETLDPSQLKDLATLFQYARDNKRATEVTLRRAEIGAPADQADALLSLAQPLAWRTAKTVEGKRVVNGPALDTMRSYLTRLDAIGKLAAYERAQARISLYYALNETDSAASVKSYPSDAMKILAEIPDRARRARGYGIVSIYAANVKLLQAKGDSVGAEALRLKGIAEFLETGQAGELIQMTLLDKPSPPLVATHWFNAPLGFGELNPRGKVTLVMLTAHW